MPQKSTRNWYIFGTAKYVNRTAQMKTLSTDRLFSSRNPEMYSPAASAPTSMPCVPSAPMPEVLPR